MKEMQYTAKRKLEVLYSGEYQGHKFTILNLGTHPTAYVECKFDNCNSYDDDRLDAISVHGGFTYFDRAYWDKEDDTTYLGWDYAHYADYAGYEVNFPIDLRSNGRKWTTNEIYEEVKSVITQLSTLEEKEGEKSCKDCVHSEICLKQYEGLNQEMMFKECKRFKNKADFVEVVRCKDCKHKLLTEGNRVMCSRNAQKMECFADWYGLTATDDNHFCSYGERKGGTD